MCLNLNQRFSSRHPLPHDNINSGINRLLVDEYAAGSIMLSWCSSLWSLAPPHPYFACPGSASSGPMRKYTLDRCPCTAAQLSPVGASSRRGDWQRPIFLTFFEADRMAIDALQVLIGSKRVVSFTLVAPVLTDPHAIGQRLDQAGRYVQLFPLSESNAKKLTVLVNPRIRSHSKNRRKP